LYKGSTIESIANIGNILIKGDGIGKPLIQCNSEIGLGMGMGLERSGYLMRNVLYLTDDDIQINVEINNAYLAYRPEYIKAIMTIVERIEIVDQDLSRNSGEVLGRDGVGAQTVIGGAPFVSQASISVVKINIKIKLQKTSITLCVDNDLDFVELVSEGLDCNIGIIGDVISVEGSVDNAFLYDLANYPSLDLGKARVQREQQRIWVKSGDRGINFQCTIDPQNKIEDTINVELVGCEIQFYSQFFMRLIDYIQRMIVEQVTPGFQAITEKFQGGWLMEKVWELWTDTKIMRMNFY
jgi:hypothetical protein